MKKREIINRLHDIIEKVGNIPVDDKSKIEREQAVMELENLQADILIEHEPIR